MKISIKEQVVFICLFIYPQNISTKLLHITNANKDAVKYVGNAYAEHGEIQLELLLREGLKKDDYVLEIGCGALVASIPIMYFLQKGHFVGIDPNKWLIDATLQINENLEIVDDKQPVFLYDANFDASSSNISFDYIIAHSIMSHAPLWQFKLFLKNCSKVLKDGGKVIFSLRLTEPNEFSNTGVKEESTTNEWQYPENTFFHKKTILLEASKYFRKIEYKKLYTELIIQADRSAFHDWFVLTK